MQPLKKELLIRYIYIQRDRQYNTIYNQFTLGKSGKLYISKHFHFNAYLFDGISSISVMISVLRSEPNSRLKTLIVSC